MKFELTMKGGIQARPLKSSDAHPHPPVVTPLNKSKILLKNVPTVPPSIPIADAVTKITTTGLNTAVSRRSLMIHQSFG